MFCVKINLNDYTMSVPLQILKPLAADFDGILLISLLKSSKQKYVAVVKLL